MQRISLVDETFDFNFTLEYKLSIQLSLDGFSFSILDTIQNKVIYLYHQELFEAEPEFLLKRIKAIYEESDLLQLPFKKTRIIIVAPNRTTLVPDEIYQAEDCVTYHQVAFQALEKRQIKSSYIPSAKYWSVYEIPQVISNFLEEKHPGAEFINDLNLSFPEHLDAKKVLKITVFKKHLVLIGFDEMGLNFHNSFFYDGENDMLFYILGSVKNMASEPDLILLDGMVNKHATIYHRLRQYFAQVEILSNPKKIHYSYLFDKLPDARFVNLFNSFE
ncbi:DUF3822 family protein [Mangrovibacterium lignilyticum]|uniref:DUF3822 family protein n=1 Tax=Mangrovibacterium lignilyticum TaxID=2668052 RepID=UPI0013D66737|nr:DUF3822 family protein [Mangrovibacterium lignilyticum]